MNIDLLDRATYAAIQLHDSARRGETLSARDARTASEIIRELVRELALATARANPGEDVEAGGNTMVSLDLDRSTP